MKMNLLPLLLLSVLVGLLGAPSNLAQSRGEEIDARSDTSVFTARLGSKEAVDRQQAAEALARLAAVDQKKLIEGYRLQEKNKSVRLALDWALYRIGNQNALFEVIQALGSARHDQAVGYLRQFDSPSMLNGLLAREKTKPRIVVGLIEALAQIGDKESLELIQPLRNSFAPGVAAAAELAAEEIENRLATVEEPVPSRPRTIGNSEAPQ